MMSDKMAGKVEDESQLNRIREAMRSYPDFPKKGILFFDIFSILQLPSLTQDLMQVLEARVRQHCPQVDVFVGLDSRGFLFGMPLAMTFAKPFVPIRKKGKLPGKINRVAYQLEYGEDILEIQSDSLMEGKTVVIVDDLLATGGTLKASNDLISDLKCKVGLNIVCLELMDLKGRDRVNSPVQSLLQY